MASQRIVLTSPWKLGLFVFLLVVGTGFGLIYAYLELFNGEVDLSNEETVRALSYVLGGVAGIGILGYLACVTAARPLDRVVQGGKRREKVMKKLSKVDDPLDVDLDQFDDEPALVGMLERWADDARAVSDARGAMDQQRQALSALADQVHTAGGHGVSLDPEQSSPELDPLVEAINAFAREAVQGAEATATPAAPSADMRAAVEELGQQHAEMQGFVESIARTTSEMSKRGDSSNSAPIANVSLLERSGQRLEDLRVTLEGLAEETNKLAITAALQISRLGDGGNELLETAEALRALSTRYQRLSGDLRMCETDHEATLQQVKSGGGGGSAPSNVDALAMVLDQNTEALREVFERLSQPMRQLSAGTGASLPDGPIAPATASLASRPMAAPASSPTPPAPARASAEAESEERIYAMEELGGREIAAEAPSAPEQAASAAASDDNIFELEQFGAVELS